MAFIVYFIMVSFAFFYGDYLGEKRGFKQGRGCDLCKEEFGTIKCVIKQAASEIVEDMEKKGMI